MKKFILGLITLGLLSTNAFAEMSADEFRAMMSKSEAQGFCGQKWKMSYWQENKTGVTLRKIGKQKYMTKCISIRVNREAETSDEIAKKVIKYYKK